MRGAVPKAVYSFSRNFVDRGWLGRRNNDTIFAVLCVIITCTFVYAYDSIRLSIMLAGMASAYQMLSDEVADVLVRVCALIALIEEGQYDVGGGVGESLMRANGGIVTVPCLLGYVAVAKVRELRTRPTASGEPLMPWTTRMMGVARQAIERTVLLSVYVSVAITCFPFVILTVLSLATSGSLVLLVLVCVDVWNPTVDHRTALIVAPTSITLTCAMVAASYLLATFKFRLAANTVLSWTSGHDWCGQCEVRRQRLIKLAGQMPITADGCFKQGKLAEANQCGSEISGAQWQHVVVFSGDLRTAHLDVCSAPCDSAWARITDGRFEAPVDPTPCDVQLASEFKRPGVRGLLSGPGRRDRSAHDLIDGPSFQLRGTDCATTTSTGNSAAKRDHSGAIVSDDEFKAAMAERDRIVSLLAGVEKRVYAVRRINPVKVMSFNDVAERLYTHRGELSEVINRHVRRAALIKQAERKSEKCIPDARDHGDNERGGPGGADQKTTQAELDAARQSQAMDSSVDRGVALRRGRPDTLEVRHGRARRLRLSMMTKGHWEPMRIRGTPWRRVQVRKRRAKRTEYRTSQTVGRYGRRA
jgi:hypothetical protein